MTALVCFKHCRVQKPFPAYTTSMRLLSTRSKTRLLKGRRVCNILDQITAGRLLFTRMRTHMTCYQVRTIRCLAADPARKHLLAYVLPHVTDEVIALCNFLAAQVAREVFFTSVDMQMSFEFREIWKCRAANAARMNFPGLYRLTATYGFIFTSTAGNSFLGAFVCYQLA